jgi:AcrR family transcriptional regulator
MQLPDLNIPEKEKKILEAAITIISEKGFNAATTSEIARAAGVAEGTIFRYFKTKKDILRSILIHVISLMGEPLVLEGVKKILLNSRQKDLRSILKDFLKDRITLINSLFPMIRILLTEALYHEDIREALYENIVSKALGIFNVFYEQMLERGMMRKDLDPVVAIRCIIGNIVFLFIYRKFVLDNMEPDDLEQEMDRVIDVIMFGIASPAMLKRKEA